MNIRISTVLILLFSLPVWAQGDLGLQHELLGVESTGAGSLLSYRITLENPGSHQYRDIELQLENVALSLSAEPATLKFHTLAAGTSKSRLLSFASSLPAAQMQQPELLLFHLQAVDENGNPVSHLLRSSGSQP